MQAGQHVIQVDESGRYVDLAAFPGKLVHLFICFDQHLAQRNQGFVAGPVHHDIEDGLFSVCQDRFHRFLLAEAFSGDRPAGLDHPAQRAFLKNDIDICLDVGGSRYGIHDLHQVGVSADAVQGSLAGQFGMDGYKVNR